jgi:hypothetical protein
VYGLTSPGYEDGSGVAHGVEDGVGVGDVMLLESLLAIEIVIEVLDETASKEEAPDQDELLVGDGELVAAGDDELVADKLAIGGASSAMARNPACMGFTTVLTPPEEMLRSVMHVSLFIKSISIQAGIVEK